MDQQQHHPHFHLLLQQQLILHKIWYASIKNKAFASHLHRFCLSVFTHSAPSAPCGDWTGSRADRRAPPSTDATGAPEFIIITIA